MQYIKRVKKLEERFNLPGFMEYLQQTFQGFENAFLRETIEKIVWNALGIFSNRSGLMSTNGVKVS